MSTRDVAEFRQEPFSHTSMPAAIESDLANATLQWMETNAPWKLRIASFYEQWELHIDPKKVPAGLSPLVSSAPLGGLVNRMLEPLAEHELELNEITAHKLVSGQTIRIHNDYLEGRESHRLLVQLNRNWTDSQGGFLMLFGSADPSDIRRVIRPLHGSAFAFAISPRSFHAVSQIQGGERYTLVYSFRTATVG